MSQRLCAPWERQLEVALLPALHRPQLGGVDHQDFTLPHLLTHKCEALRVVDRPTVVAAKEKSTITRVVAPPSDSTVCLLPARLTLKRRPELALLKCPCNNW